MAEAADGCSWLFYHSRIRSCFTCALCYRAPQAAAARAEAQRLQEELSEVKKAKGRLALELEAAADDAGLVKSQLQAAERRGAQAAALREALEQARGLTTCCCCIACTRRYDVRNMHFLWRAALGKSVPMACVSAEGGAGTGARLATCRSHVALIQHATLQDSAFSVVVGNCNSIVRGCCRHQC